MKQKVQEIIDYHTKVGDRIDRLFINHRCTHRWMDLHAMNTEKMIKKIKQLKPKGE